MAIHSAVGEESLMPHLAELSGTKVLTTCQFCYKFPDSRFGSCSCFADMVVPRGRDSFGQHQDSWWWPKGSRPLGTRMVWGIHTRVTVPPERGSLVAGWRWLVVLFKQSKWLLLIGIVSEFVFQIRTSVEFFMFLIFMYLIALIDLHLFNLLIYFYKSWKCHQRVC